MHSNALILTHKPSYLSITHVIFIIRMNFTRFCLQRLCFCSSALPKPRPVPDTKRGTKITLIAYTSPRYCRSILLAPVPFSVSGLRHPESIVKVSCSWVSYYIMVSFFFYSFLVHEILSGWCKSEGATEDNLSIYNC